MDKIPEQSATLSANPLQPIMELLQGGNPALIALKYGITQTELEERFRAYQRSRMEAALTDSLTGETVGRNEPCPCGSGKKYKKCCMAQHEASRKMVPERKATEIEAQAKKRKKVEKEIEKGFQLLYEQEYDKAKRLAERLLDEHPEDDRLHDILYMEAMNSGRYDEAFHLCRRRWQVAHEEKAYFQQHGFHKRASGDPDRIIHFYAPSTWLEKFWIAQRARHWKERYPANAGSSLHAVVKNLHIANDVKRFPGRQEKGLEMRKEALAPVLRELESAGEAAIPYLLPLTVTFSWTSLFVPDLLLALGAVNAADLLAEMAMFRFPYFSQLCLANLETLGEAALPALRTVIEENPAFDELKGGLVAVLGSIATDESFSLLSKLAEHENFTILRSVQQALSRHPNPEAAPLAQAVIKKLESQSELAGIMEELVREKLG